MREIGSDGISNIELIVEETLESDTISATKVEETALRLEPEDRIQYLNALLSFEGMELTYAEKFKDDVPVIINRLMMQTVEEIKKAKDVAKEEMDTDSLTGLKTRKYMEQKDKEQKDKYAVLMMDLDKFKRWNDTYGHDVGDIALKVLGRILRDSIRKTEGSIGRYEEGYVARYGGEEFYAELNKCNVDDAIKVAERIRSNVSKYGMNMVGEELKNIGAEDVFKSMIANELTITISIGVADENEGNKTPEEVRKRADIALYNAKTSGRDRAVKYEDGMTIPSKP